MSIDEMVNDSAGALDEVVVDATTVFDERTCDADASIFAEEVGVDGAFSEVVTT